MQTRKGNNHWLHHRNTSTEPVEVQRAVEVTASLRPVVYKDRGKDKQVEDKNTMPLLLPTTIPICPHAAYDANLRNAIWRNHAGQSGEYRHASHL